MSLDAYALDPAARAATFVVIDFEGVTPAGYPAEPIEVGAVLLRLHLGRHGWGLAETGRFEALIRPPRHAPLTAFHTGQTGITAAMLAGQPDAATALATLGAALPAPPYVTVAHHAPTEAAILRRYATACPALAAAPILDTVRLARHTHPHLPNHQLDTVLATLDVPIPAGRHRATPDAVATAALLRVLLADGARRLRWSTLAQLQTLAGHRSPVDEPTLF